MRAPLRSFMIETAEVNGVKPGGRLRDLDRIAFDHPASRVGKLAVGVFAEPCLTKACLTKECTGSTE